MSDVDGVHDGGITEADLGPDPFERFRAWFDEARVPAIFCPEAVALATADAAGRPAVRHVLVKGVDERGFTFFTNRESRKARHLAENPNAALAFLWRELDRQVCVTGTVAQIDDAESDAYFATRPRVARLGAWASRQSVRRRRRAVPRPGAAPGPLGRVPPRARFVRVLEGPRASPPRPVPVLA